MSIEQGVEFDMVQLFNDIPENPLRPLAFPEAWIDIIRLAYQYGWQPKKVVPSHPLMDEPFRLLEGNYVFIPTQIVTAEDAAALADALERALPDIPDESVIPPLIEGIRCPEFEPELPARFSGRKKEDLLMLIGFCREGSFRITRTTVEVNQYLVREF